MIDDLRLKIREILFENESILERVADTEVIIVAEKLYNNILKLFKSNQSNIVNIIDPVTDKIIFTVNIENVPFGYAAKYNFDKKVISINAFRKSQKDFQNKNYTNVIAANKTEIIHEIIHYLDSERTNTRSTEHGWNQKNDGVPEELTPSEFNAYFIQTAQRIKDQVVNVDITTFDNIFGSDVRKFNIYFWNELSKLSPNVKKQVDTSPVWKTKWTKRIYQLYFELKQLVDAKIKPLYNPQTNNH